MVHGSQITLLQKVQVIGVLVAAVLRGLSGAVWAAFAGRKVLTSAVTLAVNTFFNQTTPEMMQWALPTTAQIYRILLKNQSFVLPSGAQGYWIGSIHARKVIVYFHGGGYACPASSAHILWLDSIKDKLKAQNVSVLLVSYTLTPHAKYPTQLRQAVSMLQHLIDDGLRPSQIILGGDSAGGNLAIAVLSHLMHPHPAIPAVSIAEPLLGTFLISPWTTFDYRNLHMQHARWDMLNKHVLQQAKDAFIDGPSDAYSEPNTADEKWWYALNDVCEKFFVWYGADEVLRNGIEEYLSVAARHNHTSIRREPFRGHVGIIMDHFIPGLRDMSDNHLILWLQDRFRQ